MTTPQDRADRYRQHLCIDCGTARHSPGRPRCQACHTASVPALEPGLKRKTPRRRT